MTDKLSHWAGLDLKSVKGLARAISLVENDTPGSFEWLASLDQSRKVPIIGITGPPGAGKSTLVSALISFYLGQDKKVGVIAVDPTSPFNLGSLLGDRIRMAEHYTHPNVFIRSLATRGSLGGLSAKAIEITSLMQAAAFDLIIIETVGVGQSEIEIAGLADTTVVVLVPEAGDDIQGLKSGIMEIADVFVVNKFDRPGADTFLVNIKKILQGRPKNEWQVPVIGTVAQEKKGIEELATAIEKHTQLGITNQKKALLMADKAWHLIQNKRMKPYSKKEMANEITSHMQEGSFNLYRYVDEKLA
jgi:LAO/AO transport system kinase